MRADVSEILPIDFLADTKTWPSQIAAFRKFWRENENHFPHAVRIPWHSEKQEDPVEHKWLKARGVNRVDGSVIVCVHLNVWDGVRRLYRFRHEADAVEFKLLFG